MPFPFCISKVAEATVVVQSGLSCCLGVLGLGGAAAAKVGADVGANTGANVGWDLAFRV